MASRTGKQVIRLLSKRAAGRPVSAASPAAAMMMTATQPAASFATMHHSSRRTQSSVAPTKYYHGLELPKGAGVVVTYIWIDGSGERLRSKTKVMDERPQKPSDVDSWNYDGSSTGQASGQHSDMTLRPVALCPDPFLKNPHVLVLCDTYNHKGEPDATNHRAKAMEALAQVEDQEPWFGMEQEYTLLQKTGRPLGWPEDVHSFPGPQGPYYCAHGAMRSWGRVICEAHLFACMYAGIKNTGTNGEVMPGQWEYQIGPLNGIEVADQLWLSRYILERMAEEYEADVTLDPKPVPGDWNGTGNHCNFSTKAMREKGGYAVIEKAITERLAHRHREHIEAYDPSGGEMNKRRLTGAHETASIDDFSWGVGNRGVSIRIPRPVAEKGYGWLEDRRPSANCDPYAVVDRMIRTVCLGE